MSSAGFTHSGKRSAFMVRSLMPDLDNNSTTTHAPAAAKRPKLSHRNDANTSSAPTSAAGTASVSANLPSTFGLDARAVQNCQNQGPNGTTTTDFVPILYTMQRVAEAILSNANPVYAVSQMHSQANGLHSMLGAPAVFDAKTWQSVGTQAVHGAAFEPFCQQLPGSWLNANWNNFQILPVKLADYEETSSARGDPDGTKFDLSIDPFVLSAYGIHPFPAPPDLPSTSEEQSTDARTVHGPVPAADPATAFGPVSALGAKAVPISRSIGADTVSSYQPTTGTQPVHEQLQAADARAVPGALPVAAVADAQAVQQHLPHLDPSAFALNNFRPVPEATMTTALEARPPKTDAIPVHGAIPVLTDVNAELADADSEQKNDYGSEEPTMRDPQKMRRIQQQLMLLFHAKKCLQKHWNDQHDDSIGSQPSTTNCDVPLCPIMRDTIVHMTKCMSGKQCKYPHCLSSRQILYHWKNCKDALCPVCVPVRKSGHRYRPYAA